MPSHTEMILWALTTLAELLAAYIFILWGIVRDFRIFTGYLIFSVASSVTDYLVLRHYGFLSREYFECASVDHALATAILYASVGELAVRRARSPRVSRHLIGLFCAGVVAAILLNDGSSSENLFRLSGAVVVGICVWSFWQKGRESGKRLLALRLAGVMGVYFFLCAIVYGLFYLDYSGASVWRGLASAWLPIGASLVAITPHTTS